MPPLNQQVEIGPADGPRRERIILRVDPDSAYSVVPAPVLTMLGIEPRWSWEFLLPDGSQGQRQLAEINMRLGDQARTTVCIFGNVDSEPVLGKHTLDAFGLTVDEANERLVSARFGLG